MKKSLVSLVVIVSFIGIHISTANAEDAGVFVPAANAKISQTIRIEKITSTSAEILWVSYDANTNIKWGDDVKHLSSQVTADCTTVPVVANQHCRKLENLKADSTYYFRIPTSDGYAGFLYLVGGSFVTHSDETSTAVASTSQASSGTESRPGFLIRIWSFVTSLFN